MADKLQKSLLWVLALASMVQFVGPSYAQGTTERLVRSNIDPMLSDHRAETWQERRKAFYGFIGGFDYQTWLIGSKLDAIFQANPDRADKLKLALIGLLSVENAAQKT